MAGKKVVKKVTAKSVITNGIKQGHTIARIVKDTLKKVPGSRITEQVVRVYASTMFKNKEINLDQKNKYLIRKKDKSGATIPKKKVAVKKAPAKKAPLKKATGKDKAAVKKAPVKKKVAAKKAPVKKKVAAKKKK